jgi:hypothetical protein
MPASNGIWLCLGDVYEALVFWALVELCVIDGWARLGVGVGDGFA